LFTSLKTTFSVAEGPYLGMAQTLHQIHIDNETTIRPLLLFPRN
jgi:hypothetical protein